MPRITGDLVDCGTAIGRGLSEVFEAGDFGADTLRVLRGERLGWGQLRECDVSQRQGHGDGKGASHSTTRRLRVTDERVEVPIVVQETIAVFDASGGYYGVDGFANRHAFVAEGYESSWRPEWRFRIRQVRRL